MAQSSKRDSLKKYETVVARNVKRNRIMAGFKQADIARLLGVSFQQVQKYETASNRISSGKLYAIARFLGIGVESFYEGLDASKEEALSRQVASDAVLMQLAEIQRLYLSIDDEEQRENCLSFVRIVAKNNM